MEEGFKKSVFELALNRLSVEFQLDRIEYGLLRDIVEECFLIEADLSKERKAELILAILFGILVRGFDFEGFLRTVPKNVRVRFLSTLLFQIYYRNFKLEYLTSKEVLGYFLSQTVALFTLPEEKSEGFLQFCKGHYDEGAYRVVQQADVVSLVAPKEHYIAGLRSITFALPTKGKELSQYAWVPSVTKALEQLCSTLGIENNIPIFIYDQSEPELFAKNDDYLKSVSKNCLHIGAEEALRRAKEKHVEELIAVGGYGGARNAIFLLLDPGTIIHMGDDDVHVPVSTLFNDALFAYSHKDEYFCKYGWVKGRKTVWTESSFNLEYILEHTPEIVLQHRWVDEPFRHGMAGLLTKPKLCLNLPFGQEEAHMRAMKEYTSDPSEPMLHLSGYRFPKVDIPTNRFSGLADYLRAHYSYAIGAMLVSDLIDPLDRFSRCCLPWNRLKEPFGSIQEAITYICSADVVAAMQQGFEANVKTLQKGESTDLALYHMKVLEEQNVDAITAQYSQFPKEMAEIRMLFKELESDYASFKQLLAGQSVDAKYPMTQSLALIMQIIRNATFQASLAKLSYP